MTIDAEAVRRYSRQLLVPEIGIAGQERLMASSVLTVGAGGLGSPALQVLAAAGVGRITVIDPDTVDVTNLHRQTISRRPTWVARKHRLRHNVFANSTLESTCARSTKRSTSGTDADSCATTTWCSIAPIVLGSL